MEIDFLESTFLIGSIQINQINADQALNIYRLMTSDVKQPKNSVDRASFWHDKYEGANLVRPSARRANNEWIKNAWKGAKTPQDYLVASVGTVLFKTINWTNDLRYVKAARRENLSRPKKWRL